MSDNDLTIVGEYYRSSNGAVIHLAPCSRMGRTAVRWSYADRMGLREVATVVNSSDWMRLCKRCWPVAAWSSAHPVAVGDNTHA